MVDNFKKKKALIVNIENHNYAGGIETYSRNIMNIMHEAGYEVWEYSTCKNIQTKVCERLDFVNNVPVERQIILSDNNSFTNHNILQLLRDGIDDLKTMAYQNKHLKKVVKDFDIVIDNSAVWTPLSDKDHDKIVWVQHFDFEYLKKVAFSPRLMLKAFMKINFPYLSIRKKVVYSQNSVDKYKKLFKKKYWENAEFHKIFLSGPTVDEQLLSNVDITAKYKLPIVFMGRIKDIKQKRIDIANNIAKHLKRDIYVYGNHDDEMVRKYKFLKFKGPYSAKKDLPRIFNNSSMLLVTSQIEGACYVVLESMMHNTPAAIRNTYVEAKTLIDRDNGILFDKNESPESMANKIEKFLSDQTCYENAIKATKIKKEEFKNEIFVQKWSKLLSDLSK